MILTNEGLCRGDFCSRFSDLKTISTYSRFVLATISTEAAYRIRCDCPECRPWPPAHRRDLRSLKKCPLKNLIFADT